MNLNEAIKTLKTAGFKPKTSSNGNTRYKCTLNKNKNRVKYLVFKYDRNF